MTAELVVTVELDRGGWHVARLATTGREVARARRRDQLDGYLRDTHASVVQRTRAAPG